MNKDLIVKLPFILSGSERKNGRAGRKGTEVPAPSAHQIAHFDGGSPPTADADEVTDTGANEPEEDADAAVDVDLLVQQLTRLGFASGAASKALAVNVRSRRLAPAPAFPRTRPSSDPPLLLRRPTRTATLSARSTTCAATSPTCVCLRTKSRPHARPPPRPLQRRRLRRLPLVRLRAQLRRRPWPRTSRPRRRSSSSLLTTTSPSQRRRPR